MQFPKIPNWAWLALAAAVAYYLYTRPRTDKRTLESLSDARAQQLAGGDIATITETEAKNVCRRLFAAFEDYWTLWGDSAAISALTAVKTLVMTNRANTILVSRAWSTLYGGDSESYRRDIVSFLQSETIGWGQAYELRAELVARFSEFAT
jgi:hypothetical protein